MLATKPVEKKRDTQAIAKEFCDLIKEVDEKDKAKNILTVIADSIETRTLDNKNFLFKFFVLNKNTGKMTNKDEAENVSFRVDTLNMIFSIIADALDANDSTPSSDEVFFNAGKQCGRNFGREFIKQLDDKHKNVEDIIQKWCEFDSTVGWGKFRYEAYTDTVVVENSFQVRDYTPGTTRNCTFIKGYVNGVLSTVLPQVKILEEQSCDNCPKKCKIYSSTTECRFKLDLGE